MMSGLEGPISSERVVRYFAWVTLLNILLGVAFTLPTLHPALAIPIKLTLFPGIWMLVAYTIFLLVGILGFAGWTLGYHLLHRAFRRMSLPKWTIFSQLVLGEVGIVVFTVILFLGAYQSSTATYQGSSPVLAGLYAEWVVIPTGISLVLVLISNVIGAYNGVRSVLASRPEQSIEQTDKPGQ